MSSVGADTHYNGTRFGCSGYGLGILFAPSGSCQTIDNERPNFIIQLGRFA
jgi:hypothetical protein